MSYRFRDPTLTAPFRSIGSKSKYFILALLLVSASCYALISKLLNLRTTLLAAIINLSILLFATLLLNPLFKDKKIQDDNIEMTRYIHTISATQRISFAFISILGPACIYAVSNYFEIKPWMIIISAIMPIIGYMATMPFTYMDYNKYRAAYKTLDKPTPDYSFFKCCFRSNFTNYYEKAQQSQASKDWSDYKVSSRATDAAKPLGLIAGVAELR